MAKCPTINVRVYGETIAIPAASVLKFSRGGVHVDTSNPPALAALAILMAAVEKCVVDVASDVKDVNSPLALILDGLMQVPDFIALWPDIKAVMQDLGVSI